MENSLIVIVLIAVVLILGTRYWQSRIPTRERKLRYGKRGELVAIEEVIGQQPITLKGKGNHATKPLPMEAGAYKLEYIFPDDVLVKVDLWLNGDSETIVVKRGTGTASFNIDVTARYVFEIAPADEAAAWEITVTRRGLPSKSHPSAYEAL